MCRRRAASRPALGGADDDAQRHTSRPPRARRWPWCRAAAQNLYAPLRTGGALAGIGRVNLRPRAGHLAAHAAGARRRWPVRRLEDQWVTAVKLTNTSGRWLDLDPRALQGDFLAATFQHRPGAGRPRPTPRWSTVTRGHGLAESLLPAGADRRDGEPAAGRGGRPRPKEAR
jgi:hypothetical protein